MLINLEKLQVQVRPQIIKEGKITIAYLDKESYANSLELLLNQANKSIRLTMYSVNKNSSIKSKNEINIYRIIKELPIRIRNCYAVFAKTKKNIGNINFNKRAAKEFKEAGWKIRWAESSELLHQKQIIIDNSICIIGSHNISRSSSTKNRDVSLAIESEELAVIASKEFINIYRKAKREI